MVPQDSAVDAGGERTASRDLDGSLRTRIVEAATRLFAERGFRGTHIQEVARAAGCTKPALYYHFDGKEALFLEAIERVAAEVRERHRRAVAQSTCRERLEAGVRMIFELVRDEPHGLRMVFRASRSPDEGQPEYDFDRAIDQEVATTRAVLEDGIRSGELRADLDPVLAADLLAGGVERHLLRAIAGERVPPDFPSRVIDSVLRGWAS